MTMLSLLSLISTDKGHGLVIQPIQSIQSL